MRSTCARPGSATRPSSRSCSSFRPRLRDAIRVTSRSSSPSAASFRTSGSRMSIKAFALYQRRHAPKASLVLVGPYQGFESYRHALDCSSARSGERACSSPARSRGARDAWYRRADAYLSMSVHEGFCMPLIEALAHGVPVVANDAGACPRRSEAQGLSSTARTSRSSRKRCTSSRRRARPVPRSPTPRIGASRSCGRTPRAAHPLRALTLARRHVTAYPFAGSAPPGRWYGAWPCCGGGRIAVSVIVNTVDRCESLRRTLDGLARQTFRPFEVVVVNGPSADGTAEILTRYPVRIGTCSEAHVGLSRNVGVRMAAGDVLAFIDDDAVPEPDWLEQLAGAYADPTVAAAGGPVFDVPLGRIEWAICTCMRDGAANTNSDPPAESYLGRGSDPFLYLAGCDMSFRRSALREAGGFNAMLSYLLRRRGDLPAARRRRQADRLGRRGARHPPPGCEQAAERGTRDHGPVPGLVLRGESSWSSLRRPGRRMCSRVGSPAWSNGQAELVPEERRNWFRERVEQGVADGRRAGRKPRPDMQLGRQPRREFRPFV